MGLLALTFQSSDSYFVQTVFCMTSSEAGALWRRHLKGRNGVLFDSVASAEAGTSHLL